MEKNATVPVLSITLVLSLRENAQWCVPAVFPYGPAMPGITQFKLNTIDRTSQALESPTGSCVFTGEITTLVRGKAYSISITHTVDATYCPDVNLRVWNDFNEKGDLDDNGETVLSVDHHLPGTYATNFTVPSTAMAGTTRLSATA